MEESQAVREMMKIISKWDPFKYGEEFYETEAVDIVQAVYAKENPQALAESIQEIFETSFEQILPLDNCMKVAEQLLIIKDSSSCTP
ncbi:DUF1871 family protein [Bacillus atrophaeus]|uniref:DUF1871 family protein n=1 Tax=Bacillus atrophaeus TaxID=1452 RepID=UPI002280AD01|nr:DUF1871 family protein [Bacillus atrophaeus]MCY8835657.1 YugE family protein [Bacillus atrophaeus]MEC1901047.1 DUF1871 family protein [Bacillus atrophaeus]MEC2396212.1 DUF1871 family protein [Bacillus atrophaeus]MEC5222203.1 DUF1871 family protein [Bacillus atrophaeus]MED4437384.1 DUF1871 family protein [Bacillus atrophaeus]